MDTRLSIRTLGLKTGDAHIIRNAGGIVTDDALRSFLVSHYLLQKLRTHPWIPEIVVIRGFVYDVATGLLREIRDG
jgi:carbonic anhydrase